MSKIYFGAPFPFSCQHGLRGKPRLDLLGHAGNDFAILVKAKHAARKAGWTEEEIADFKEEAMSKNHDHLLHVCSKYFDVY